MEWISVKDRLPDKYHFQFLKWTYSNGNTGMAVGWLEDNNEWMIAWSDDYPSSKEISHWITL